MRLERCEGGCNLIRPVHVCFKCSAFVCERCMPKHIRKHRDDKAMRKLAISQDPTLRSIT